MSSRVQIFRLFLLGVCLLLLSAQESLAAACQGRSDEPVVRLLQPPPCETCEGTKAELAELLTLERARTPEQAEHATEDVKRSVARFLEGGNIKFDAAKLASCGDFFLKRRKEEKAVVDAAKNAFCRPRPFLTDGNALHPVDDAKPDVSYSYPSGHATYGATIGFLLAEMLPEKRAEIYSRINDYAHSRMVAGVHFRSDVEAGKLFGAVIGASLLAKPDFHAEFEEAKTCVRKAVGLP